MRMRIAAFSMVLVVLVMTLTGCMPGADTPMETQLVLSDVAGLSVEKGKADAADDAYGLTELEYYYDIQTLPDGAVLQDLKIARSVTRVSYTFGPVAEDSFDNRIELIWYRSAQGNEFLGEVAKSGEHDVVESETLRYLKHTVQAKSATDEDVVIDYCQLVYWSQDNRAFMAAVPLGFTDEDIVRHCVAVQVEVE